MAVLSNIFGDQTVSRSLWPASSLNMNVCEYYLWGGLKEKRLRTIRTHTHTHTHKSTHEQTSTHRINMKKITETAVWVASRQEGYISITCLPGDNTQAISKSCSHTRRLLQYRLLTWFVCGVFTFGWAFCRRYPSAYFLAVKLSYYLGTKYEDPQFTLLHRKIYSVKLQPRFLRLRHFSIFALRLVSLLSFSAC